MIREKEEEINKDLQECTFAPRINEQPPRHELTPSRSLLKVPTKKSINPYYSPIKNNKSPTPQKPSPPKKPKVELHFAKNIIRS